MNASGRRAWRLLGVLSLLVLCMCRACWLPSRGIDRAVAPEETVGTWALTEATLALFVRDGYVRDASRTHTLVLREDGTASMNAAGAMFEGLVYVAADGTWRATSADEKTGIRLELRRDGTLTYIPMTFDEDDDGLVLFQFHGDPDSWEFIEYRRAP